MSKSIARMNYAIKIGWTIRRLRCESCGKITKIEAHHDDYNEPYDVKWMCKSCHRLYHNDKLT